MNTPIPSNMRIVAIDDDPVSLKLIEAVLKTEGFTNFKLLPSAEACVEEFALACPDLVITDLHMPHFDGMQVIDWVRACTPPGEIIPVLVLTAVESTEKKRDALAAGATDFILKPFDPTEFRARARNLLRIRQLHLATVEYSRQLEVTVAARTRDLATALEDLKTNQAMLLQQGAAALLRRWQAEWSTISTTVP